MKMQRLILPERKGNGWGVLQKVLWRRPAGGGAASLAYLKSEIPADRADIM